VEKEEFSSKKMNLQAGMLGFHFALYDNSGMPLAQNLVCCISASRQLDCNRISRLVAGGTTQAALLQS
jgi:hypothetical protein